MCGRFSQTANKDTLTREFRFRNFRPKNFKPRYNIFPSDVVVGLVRDPGLSLAEFRWGLIPPWAKDPAIGNRMINARKETLAEKPSFRAPLRDQRCLIVADGFFEWKAEARRKVPYYIRLKSKRPFTFAGLWSDWQCPGEGMVLSCAIITGEPNALVLPIHERMPVIIPEARRGEWLDPSNHDVDGLLKILEPYPAGEMEAYPVSRIVNSPQNDVPECLEPVLTN